MPPQRGALLAFVLGCLAFIACAFVSSFVFPFGAFGLDSFQQGRPLWLPFVSILTSLLSPLLAGFLVARTILRMRKGSMVAYTKSESTLDSERQARQDSGRDGCRFWIKALVAVYLATWLYGAPAVQSKIDLDVFKRFEEAKDHGRAQTGHPNFKTSIMFPVLPCVFVSYHEYQVAPLWGWGGWEVDLWYVFGVKELLRFGVWIS